MSIYKRGDTYWVHITTPSGRRIRQSSGTKVKREAQEFHDQLKAQCWRIEQLGDRPRRTWEEAVTAYIKLDTRTGSKDALISILKWLHPFLSNTFLDEISREMIEAIADKKLDEGVSRSTVNRHLEVIRAILRKARDDWEWIDRIPKIQLRKTDNRRIRYLTQAEYAALQHELPDHLKGPVAFAVMSGLRAGNIRKLKWSEVDLARHVAMIPTTKNGEPIGVYLNEEARRVIRDQIGKHEEYVFTYRGRPFSQINNRAFRNALKRAGIENFRFHDLRHTWASWHVQNGTPLYALQQQAGWKSRAMVDRYAHLEAQHFAEYGEALVGNDTKKTQPKKKG